MNDAQLRYFSVLYEKRGLSAAAKAIPMSHQGLSKNIKKLESDLEVKLFTEESRILTPTRYGDALYEFGVEYARLYRKLQDDFRKIDAKLKGEIRLGASTGVLGFLDETFFNGFTAMHPEIKISRAELPDLLCDEALKNEDCDLAFTVFPFDPVFSTIEMYRVERWVWVSAQDKLATRKSIAFEDLNGYVVGTMGPSFKNYTSLVSEFECRNIEPCRIECANEMFWLCRFAQKPGYASFTVPHIVEFFDGNRNIVAKPFPGIPWGFGISWRKNYTLSEAERLFSDYCVRYASSIKRLSPETNAKVR